MYKIKDLQNEGVYYAKGHVFMDKEQVRRNLISYHMSVIIADMNRMKQMTLEEIMNYGQWAIEEVL